MGFFRLHTIYSQCDLFIRMTKSHWNHEPFISNNAIYLSFHFVEWPNGLFARATNTSFWLLICFNRLLVTIHFDWVPSVCVIFSNLIRSNISRSRNSCEILNLISQVPSDPSNLNGLRFVWCDGFFAGDAYDGDGMNNLTGFWVGWCIDERIMGGGRGRGEICTECGPLCWTNVNWWIECGRFLFGLLYFGGWNGFDVVVVDDVRSANGS